MDVIEENVTVYAVCWLINRLSCLRVSVLFASCSVTCRSASSFVKSPVLFVNCVMLCVIMRTPCWTTHKFKAVIIRPAGLTGLEMWT